MTFLTLSLCGNGVKEIIKGHRSSSLLSMMKRVIICHLVGGGDILIDMAYQSYHNHRVRIFGLVSAWADLGF
jgi:hypothetical protein